MNAEAFQALTDVREIRKLLELMVGRSASWLKELGASLENQAEVVMA